MFVAATSSYSPWDIVPIDPHQVLEAYWYVADFVARAYLDLVLELQDIPCLVMRDSERICTSPIRGKLRAGREVVLAESNQEGSYDGNPSKAYGKLSMMERQAKWLQKRHEKVEAERARLETAKYKDVTFRPKLIRRSNSEHIHRKGLEDESRDHAQAVPRPNSGSIENLKAGSAKGRQSGTRPPMPRSASFKKKPSASQKLRVKSALLDSLKAELSISQEFCFTEQKEQVEDPVLEFVAEIEAPVVPPEPEEVTWTEDIWSENSCIGGLPVEFDSSNARARIILQDASHFDVSSMYRKTDRKARRDGIALLMGRREDNFEEQVIAVLFDMEKVTRPEAADWWIEHVHRFEAFL